MLWTTVLATALAVGRARAGAVDSRSLLGRPSGPMGQVEQRMASLASGRLGRSEDMPRVVFRRAPGTTVVPGTGVVLNADGTINMTAWEDTANAACTEALLKLPESSNPSGTCICYNLPALDNSTGTFEADLRLYQLSTPSGDFQGIPPQNIKVVLSYKSATALPVTPQTASKLVAARQVVTDPTITTGATNLTLLQTYLFVGQIDKSAQVSTLNEAQLEALVQPIVTLTGINGAGQKVSTNVSSNEASFVAGVFSQTQVLSDLAIAQKNVNAIVAGLQNGTVAFVLPGVQLILFPVGLVITSAWLVIGAVIIGSGMIQRNSFREMYRRRVAMSSKAKVGRI